MDLKERDKILAEVKRTLLNILQNKEARVYLFGSWARGDEKRTSDIDIAIDYTASDAAEVFTRLRYELEESTIPYNVDILEILSADENIVRKIKSEGILWKD